MDEMMQIGCETLASQPYSRYLGARLVRFAKGIAILEIEITENLKQQHGFVHGGVISYLADNALTFAGGSVLGDSLTSEYKINYVRPATGHKLIATAEIKYAGARQAVCQCDVVVSGEQGEKLVATAQGTIVKGPAKT